MKPRILYSRPYYNKQEGKDPRSGEVYRLCNQVKTRNPYRIPDERFKTYAYALPSKCILIPVPGHTGKATYTRDLCYRLQKACGHDRDVRVIDALTGEAHPSLCKAKREGKDTSDIEVKISINYNESNKGNLRMLSETFDIVLVDNVLDTGRTMMAAVEAVRADGAEPVCLTLGYTGNDTGFYNPYRMMEAFELKNEYKLNYISYDDEFSAKDIEECLRRKDMTPLTEKDFWSEQTSEAASEIAKEIIEESPFDDEDKERFLEDFDHYIDLCDAIEERNVSFPEKECLMQTETYGRIVIDSDCDCWVPPYDAGALYSKEDLLWGLMAELCLNPKKVKEEVLRVWDVPIKGDWPDIKARNGKEVISYKDFVNVLFECPNYGKWAFFGRFDMQALYDSKFDTDTMLIPKGTTCTMYNSWNGGGSMAFAKTLRPITVKELKKRASPHSDGVSILVDEKGCGSGYASCEVYGERLSKDELLI